MLVSILRFPGICLFDAHTTQFGMFSLLLREKVFSNLVGLETSEVVLIVTLQLYIGEANWAFIFGVIIGTCGPHHGLAVRLTLPIRSLWSKHIQSSVLGWRH